MQDDGIYFHEDDEDGIEILPAENLPFVRRQMGEIDAFSAEHDTGFGYDAIYVREAPPGSIAHWRVPFGDVTRALDTVPGLTRYDKVTSLFDCPDTVAYAIREEFEVYVSRDGDFLAGCFLIWRLWSAEPPPQLPAAVRSFFRIFSKALAPYGKLLLADWNGSYCVPDISDGSAVEAYINTCESWRQAMHDQPDKNAE